MVAMALQWEVDFADPDFPAFYRQNDDVTTWGGPNVDNTYLRARISGDRTYRLSGNVSTISNLIISTRSGDMHQEKYGVIGDLDRSELPINERGDFAILLGPDVVEGEGIRTAPDTDHVGIRIFYLDWEKETPAVFHIERIDPGPDVPSLPDPEWMDERLDAAARQVESSLPYWNAWMERSARTRSPNEVIPPRSVPGGSSDIFYGGLAFELEEDEALVIELEPPDAPYWSFQWYSYGWFEPPDFRNRQTSLNARQAHVDEDGRVRIVLSARDPGVQNWIDTTGRRVGSLAYRYIWSASAPVPTASVIAADEVRALLPESTPSFSDSDRREQIAARRRHIERRFRR